MKTAEKFFIIISPSCQTNEKCIFTTVNCFSKIKYTQYYTRNNKFE